jgi:hypothetical protein
MTRRTSTNLDDIASLIGFTATATLAAWFGGKNLCVPKVAKPDSRLAVLIGMTALKHLVAEYSSITLWIPTGDVFAAERRRSRVAVALVRGESTADIATCNAMSIRRVQQLRIELERDGLVPTQRSRRKGKQQTSYPLEHQ